MGLDVGAFPASRVHRRVLPPKELADAGPGRRPRRPQVPRERPGLTPVSLLADARGTALVAVAVGIDPVAMATATVEAAQNVGLLVEDTTA